MKAPTVSRKDWVSSLVVFVVALPLSLGIALASGVSASAGLISAVLGGIVAGSLAGAPLVVTGPAAGLTALIFQLVMQHGLEGLAIITILAGLFQIVFSLVRAGGLFRLVPKSVLEGMLGAIGFIILLGQTHVLMGADVPKTAARALGSLDDSLKQALDTSAVLVCGLIALSVQLVWPRINKKFRWLPGALPAVLLATVVSAEWNIPRVELAPLASAVSEHLSRLGAFSWTPNLWTYVAAALGVAFVASAETLLTARAVDTLATTRNPKHRPARLDRELFAQGATNGLAGLLGGIPVTGVIVRSAANLDAGAQSRASTILHGAWIALLVGLAPSLLGMIPLTALASVLILTGVKLLNLKHLFEVLRKQPLDGLVWLTTSAAILTTDLLRGLAIGLAAAAVIHGLTRTQILKGKKSRAA